MPCGLARFFPLLVLVLVHVTAAACTPLRAPRDTQVVGPAPAVEPVQQEGNRVAALLPTGANYDHFEGVAFRNACDEDSACKTGGCGNEMCTADAEVSSTCIEYPDRPQGASCGCVKGQCLWYVTGAAAEDMREKLKLVSDSAIAAAAAGPRRRTADAGPTSTLPEQGQPCADGRCAPGLECLTFFGIAGPKGGALNSCELRCGGGRQCPRNQSCATISDGPGSVCRDDSQFQNPPK